MWSYVGYEGDVGNTLEPVEDDEFLIFNNYHFMTMSMDYALATITGTYSYTTKTNAFCLGIILCNVSRSFDYLIYPYYPAYTS